MKTPAQPSLGFQPYNNRNLFAEHFLQKVLPAQAEWQAVEGVDEAFAAVQKLWSATQHFTNKTNEAQTENDLIKPVLDLLWGSGCYQVQPRIPNVDVQRQPDYALFLSDEERTAAQPLINTMEYWRDVPALADAKKWSASLDKERSADENPSAQVCNYLYRSRVRWGILSNGRTWRLYEREKSSAGGTYYEVDLADIMLREDRAAFKFFYLFFRRESLVPDASGVSFLDMVFRGSVQYAAGVGNSLKESVYDALRHLMNGFFEHSANALDRNDPETLRLVHQNSLIVLYRLLFLLYAEDRDLLPCEQEPYKEYSLRKLQKEINDRLRAKSVYLPHMTGIWGQLCNLFSLIDEGFPEGGIPAYNGGLFSPAKYPAIAQTAQPSVAPWRIGDRRIAEVVDLLAYERKAGESAGSHDIDYRTLDVQHLGSIYEGLLELQPHVAPETLVEVVEDKKTVFKPKSSSPLPAKGRTPREVAAHEIYLVTNRGERKASGSYYTPKYIVDYIVENTLGPLTDAAAEGVKTLRPEVDAAIHELQGRRKQWEAEAGRGEASAAIEIQKAEAAIELQKRRLLEPYLSLKVLDPAMGSGHFLVGAADFLSLAMATDPCLLALDESEEDPQLSFKRLVVERCLYGVDLNPLSVELAKLSLWLHTVSRDKALSFLDHHLRAGNSLIGARLEDDLMHEPPQFNAKGKRTDKNTGQLVLGLYETLTKEHLGYLLDVLRQIMETPSGDAHTEHLKDRLYREMDARREQFRAVANCWLAPYFGVPVSNEHYQSAVEALSEGADAQRGLSEHPWFQDAQQVAQQKRFFHWELEFPEVFLSPHGLKPSAERGFDAVVGNPPYGIVFDLLDKQCLERRFPVFIRNNDYYAAFTQLSIDRCRLKGSASLIVPNTFLAGPYFAQLKQFMRSTCSIRSLTDFGNTPVFEDPTVFVAIFTVDREIASQGHHVLLQGVAVSAVGVEGISQDYVLQDDMSDDYWKLISPVTKRCQEQSSETVGSLCFVKDVGFNYWTEGRAKTRGGSVADRVLYEGAKRSPDDVEFIKGSDFDCYEPVIFANRWLKANYATLIDPAVDTFRFSSNFLKAQEKIIYRQTADTIRATLDRAGYLVDKTVHVVLLKEEPSNYTHSFLITLLNSTLFQFLYKDYTREEGKAFAQVKTFNIAKLPIRRINFTTPETQRAQLLNKAQQLLEGAPGSGDDSAILSFVQEQLDAAPERADVVHDLLALLAERMIALNTQKQEEVKSFLLWLERRLNSPIDEMANKTRIKDYHSAGFLALQAVLKQNARKHKVDVEAREFETRLEAEFTQSVGKLTPLKAQIAATDNLIDEIVYKLYGLTAEEIGIVKGEATSELAVAATETD